MNVQIMNGTIEEITIFRHLQAKSWHEGWNVLLQWAQKYSTNKCSLLFLTTPRENLIKFVLTQYNKTSLLKRKEKEGSDKKNRFFFHTD
jgi:hypothetical protein